MEREFKWTASREIFEAICRALGERCGAPEQIRLRAVYYDTADGSLRERKIGMRLRQENDRSVFCVKQRNNAENGLHCHEEYEREADSVETGLAQLPDELAFLRGAEYLPQCGTEIERTAVQIVMPDFCAELVFDEGRVTAGDRAQPIAEIELEQKGGDETAFDRFGTRLAEENKLQPQPLSKLARALALK